MTSGTLVGLMTMNQNGKGPAAVEARGLVKTYDEVEAVRGVDLRVESGEVFGFLGPNGAGKSTTVKMLTTLLTITSGSAAVAGIDVAGDPDAVRLRIGVALQEAGLDPRQNGRELLILQARLFGMTTAEAAERAKELLALVMASIWPGFLVVALAGTGMLAPNVRMINNYG